MKRFIYSTLLCLILAACTGISAYSQVRDSLFIADSAAYRTAWNNAYLEAAGSNWTYSFNFERLVSDDWSLRFGFYVYDRTNSIGVIDSNGQQSLSQIQGTRLGSQLVCTASHLIGPGSHKLEIGGGFMCFIPPLYGDGLGALAGIIGYRYQPKGGGFLFRAGFTPLIFKSATFSKDFGLSFIPLGSQRTLQTLSTDIYSFPVLPWLGISFGGTF
jgi:hypothetical protein